MLSAKFGIEIEFTGITRERAARVAAEFLQGIYSEGGTYYDTKKVKLQMVECGSLCTMGASTAKEKKVEEK